MQVLVVRSSVCKVCYQSNGILIDFTKIEATMLGRVYEVSIWDLEFLLDWLIIIQQIILCCVMHFESQGWYVSGWAGLKLGCLQTSVGGSSNPKSRRTKYSNWRIKRLFDFMVSLQCVRGICSSVMLDFRSSNLLHKKRKVCYHWSAHG